MKKYILTSLCSAFLISGAVQVQAADNCTVTPDCESLGYTKTASQCSGQASIKCPWNTSKVFCENVVDPCTGITSVSIPANASCSKNAPACPSKCLEWTCNSGYFKLGDLCKREAIIQPESSCGRDSFEIICNGTTFCCPPGYADCKYTTGTITGSINGLKCYIKNQIEAL